MNARVVSAYFTFIIRNKLISVSRMVSFVLCVLLGASRVGGGVMRQNAFGPVVNPAWL